MHENHLLNNEYDVNRIMLKIFKILLIVLPFIWLLNFIRFFILPWKILLLISLSIMLFAGIPVCFFNDTTDKRIKNYAIVFFLFFSTMIYSTVFVNGIFFMIISPLVSLIYFDIKLLKISCLSIIPLMIIGEILASLTKQEFIADIKWIPMHTVVFSLQIFIIFLLLLSLAQRSKNMLIDTNKMLDKISKLYKNINSSSNEISIDIRFLHTNFNEVKDFGNDIDNFIDLTSTNTKYLNEDIQNMSKTSKEISLDIDNTYEITLEMHNEINQTSIELDENIEKISNIIKKFHYISSESERSKNAVITLSEEISEISNVIELIEKIQKQTNLLSINASIEASRIGDAGVGFRVVADGIKNLAVESGKHIEIIKKQIEKVEEKSKKTVSIIEKSGEYVKEGMNSIEDLESFLDFVEKTLYNVKSRIEKLNEKMKLLELKEHKMNNELLSIEKSNKELINKINNINKSFEKFTEILKSNINLLKNIDDKSNVLNEI